MIHSPDPASTSPTSSPVSSANAAPTAYSPGTSASSTQTVPTKAPTPTSSATSPSPTVSNITSILPSYDNPSASASASQPLFHTSQLAYLSPRALPATQTFIRDHHGCKPTLFSPRRLRSHTTKKKCLDPPGTNPRSSQTNR